MSYCALYRQWRPKDFSHVVGQRAVIETLRNQVINSRIAHAYLFCGSRGTGKTSTAKILARAINCEEPVNGDPCGKCPNCMRMEHEESLDIIEIDAASNNGVDEMRDLRDSVKYPPQYGKYRVYIIDEVHMLSTSAFNALLKTLEEPPAHIVFILATTEPQKLPETILSRCQRFDFGRISVSDIQNRLREAAEAAGASVSNGALMAIARSAEGGMRDALSILDMCLGYGNSIDEKAVREILGTNDQAFLFNFADMLAQENAAEMFRLIDRMMREGRDPGVFLKDISSHIRTLLIAKSCPEEVQDILDLTAEDADEFRRQAECFTVSRLMRILDIYMNAENELRFSALPRFALENVCLKCCVHTGEQDTRALLDRIEELERKVSALTEKIQNTSIVPQKPLVSGGKAAEQREKEIARTTLKTPEKDIQKSSGLANAWNDMVKMFRKDEPALWSMLVQGSISFPDDKTVFWNPQKREGAEFFITTLNREDKKGKIIAALRDISGIDCSFTAGTAAQNSAVQPKADDDAYLDKLYKTFGKEPVDIVE